MKFKKVQIERRIHKETSFDSDVAETWNGEPGTSKGNGKQKNGNKTENWKWRY